MHLSKFEWKARVLCQAVSHATFECGQLAKGFVHGLTHHQLSENVLRVMHTNYNKIHAETCKMVLIFPVALTYLCTKPLHEQHCVSEA